MSIIIQNKDCLVGMTNLIKNGVKCDLIISDPPYLVNYSTNMIKDKSHRFCSEIQNDDNPLLIKKFIRLSYELLKEGGAFYCFCSADYIDFFKIEISKKFKFKNILVWVKNNASVGDLKGDYGRRCEFVIFAVKGRHLLNGKRDSNILEYDRVAWQHQIHQNQKPLEMIEYLVKKSSSRGDLIIDPFVGSGTTALACKNTGRNFVGFEIDKDYYNVCMKRLNSND